MTGFDSYTILPQIQVLLLFYIAVETVFYFIFHFYLVPRANDLSRRISQPYRDYPLQERHLLFSKILNRIESKCKETNKEFRDEFRCFINNWFTLLDDKDECSLISGIVHSHRSLWSCASQSTSFSDCAMKRLDSDTSSSSASSSFEDDSVSCDLSIISEAKPSQYFSDHDLDIFFSWAFFDKHYNELNVEEKEELAKCYDILQTQRKLKGWRDHDSLLSMTLPKKKPRCMTLEPVDPIHRPLFIYILVWLGKQLCRLILYTLGFRRFIADCSTDENDIPFKTTFFRGSTILPYWYRPGRGTEATEEERVFFFHGIAPCGLLLYLPMLYATLFRHKSGGVRRDIFLFENEPITYSMTFQALSEEATTACIRKILQKHPSKNNDTGICLMGHSFGSCVITWLLHCPTISQQVRRLILLDPVSILLSEPDVMTNFLYSRSRQMLQTYLCEERRSESFSRIIRKMCIRTLASSELFTEHYLRRNFYWYNSELWLDHIPPHARTVIFLSELDSIINAQKVQAEIEYFQRQNHKHSISSACWEGYSHATCLTNPLAWYNIHRAIREETKIKND